MEWFDLKKRVAVVESDTAEVPAPEAAPDEAAPEAATEDAPAADGEAEPKAEGEEGVEAGVLDRKKGILGMWNRR